MTKLRLSRRDLLKGSTAVAATALCRAVARAGASAFDYHAGADHGGP